MFLLPEPNFSTFSMHFTPTPNSGFWTENSYKYTGKVLQLSYHKCIRKCSHLRATSAKNIIYFYNEKFESRKIKTIMYHQTQAIPYTVPSTIYTVPYEVSFGQFFRFFLTTKSTSITTNRKSEWKNLTIFFISITAKYLVYRCTTLRSSSRNGDGYWRACSSI